MFKPLPAGLAAAVALAGAAVLAPALAPALAQPSRSAEPATAGLPVVSISNFTFAPQTLSIKAGATVTWVNQDDTPHQVMAVDKSFRSKVLDTDDRFSFTFTKPGTYDYYCTIHPHMTGKVIVAPS